MNVMLILLMPSTEVTKGVKLRFSALLWITSKNSHEGFQETFTPKFFHLNHLCPVSLNVFLLKGKLSKKFVNPTLKWLKKCNESLFLSRPSENIRKPEKIENQGTSIFLDIAK